MLFLCLRIVKLINIRNSRAKLFDGRILSSRMWDNVFRKKENNFKNRKMVCYLKGTLRSFPRSFCFYLFEYKFCQVWIGFRILLSPGLFSIRLEKRFCINNTLVIIIVNSSKRGSSGKTTSREQFAGTKRHAQKRSRLVLNKPWNNPNYSVAMEHELRWNMGCGDALN